MQPKTRSKRITRKDIPANDGGSKLRAGAAAVLCGLVLISGFFFAGRQHFMSMDYGIKNSRLRKQLDDLKAEKQRLLYTKEVSLSPDEIKRAASRTGLNSQQPGTAFLEMASAKKPSGGDPSAVPATKPIIIKTGSATAVAPRVERSVAIARTDKQPNDKSQKRDIK